MAKYVPSETMFFGEFDGISRMDIMRYPMFEELLDEQMSFFWRPNEFDLSKDKIEYDNLSPAEKHIVVSNLRYQILLDSTQQKNPVMGFLPVCSLPELENWLLLWAQNESVHSQSYTHIIRSIIPDPSEIFDEVLDIPQIKKRAETIDIYYNELVDNPSVDSVYLALNMANCLEGILFYNSFLCNFALAERGKMRGLANVIQSIARDESVHLKGTQEMIKYMHQEYPELEKKYAGEVYDMFTNVASIEEEWAKYLFSEGVVLGLNTEILIKFTHYITNDRLEAIGKSPIFPECKNPCPWVEAYFEGESTQTAPQENELTSYLTGAVNATVDTDALSRLKL
jgi:ribonucleoside-diphosphate reductase beta chain